MITEKLQNAVNDQITAELWSSNLYLQMAFYFEKEGWNGFAHWMHKQSDEEREHAIRLANYLAKRGGEASVNMIDVVPSGWGSVKEVFASVGTTKQLRIFFGDSSVSRSRKRLLSMPL